MFNKYYTRKKHLLYVNKSNINVYVKSFGNTGVRVWNALLSYIDVNVPISKFKKSSKKTIYMIMHLFRNIQSKFWFQI